MGIKDFRIKGNRIEYAMETAGYNPNTMAKKLGISSSAIYQWVNGTTHNIKEDLLWKFSDLTGLEARWISQGTGPMRVEKSIKHASDVLLAMSPEARYTAVRLIDALTEPEKHNGTK